MKEFSIGGLKISIPIVQGGMGVGISLSGLASAVAKEGGVGVISSAGLGLLYRDFSKNYLEASIEGLKEELREAKARTRGIIGVNIMSAMTNFEDMVRTSINEKADIIFAGAGLPLDLPKFLKSDSITKLVPIVSSGKAARLISAKWKMNYNYLPDAFVVEGPKAGGHLGFKNKQIDDESYTLENILPDVVEEVNQLEEQYNKNIPVIAAGGIYNGNDAYKIMKMGASAVQLGTRFVTTEECDASDNFKDQYVQAKEENIKIIESPVGMPGRAVQNNFLDKVDQGIKAPKNCPFKCIKSCDVEKSPYCIINALYQAYKGNMKSGYAFAGSNAYRADKISKVKDIFADLRAGFENALRTDNTPLK
ncbi:MAG: nitronate monooxygenase family protein [Bacteroidales bacterium]|nr:nitronate monooxygenase family protein [Bacteroidales bacterium]MCF8338720.1 nitronate monooxygenase family protein [Bacteroidales bacterium]